jgi:hypothetical protein
MLEEEYAPALLLSLAHARHFPQRLLRVLVAAQAYTHTHTHTHTHIHPYKYVYACTHSYACTYIPTCALHKYIHAYIRIYIRVAGAGRPHDACTTPGFIVQKKNIFLKHYFECLLNDNEFFFFTFV